MITVLFPITFYLKKKIREIEKFIWNNEEEYNSETKENDIIILKLNKPLLLDENRVQPACLPTDLWPIRNKDNFTNECFVSGWGRTSDACKIFFENNYFSHSNMVVAFFDIEIGLAKRLHYSISLITYNSFQMDQFQNF